MTKGGDKDEKEEFFSGFGGWGFDVCFMFTGFGRGSQAG